LGDIGIDRERVIYCFYGFFRFGILSKNGTTAYCGVDFGAFSGHVQFAILYIIKAKR
jgi:hypothetical protein